MRTSCSISSSRDRRPRAWNQWPEISWRDPRSPGHLGDVPHAWIGAEYVLAVLGMLAYESPGDGSLRAGGRRVRARGSTARASKSRACPRGGAGSATGCVATGLNALRLDLAAELREPPGGIVVPPRRSRVRSPSVTGDGVASFDAAQRDHSGERASAGSTCDACCRVLRQPQPWRVRCSTSMPMED